LPYTDFLKETTEDAPTLIPSPSLWFTSLINRAIDVFSGSGCSQSFRGMTEGDAIGKAGRAEEEQVVMQ